MKKKLLLFVLLAMTIVCPVSKSSPAPPGRVQVHVLDVGEGQSILIISPTGKAALIDAGSAEAGGRVTQALRKRNVQNIELAVATQAGSRYIGGMRRVLSSSDIVVKSLVDSGQPWKTETYQQMLAARSANIPLTNAKRGQFYDLGGGLRLDIINPAGDGTWVESLRAGASREDANSVVVRLLYKDFIMLIMSGAEAGTAQQMVEAMQNIWSPVLVVGNHGSRDALSEKMLSLVKPKIAIISASAQNPPAPETLEMLRQSNAEIYRTDQQGDITITSDGKKHEVTTERKSAP